MVKRDIYGCEVVKGWSVVALVCVSSPRLEPFLRVILPVSLATTEIGMRSGRENRE